MVKLIVDGKEVDAPADKPLIEFLREIGHVPGFCYTEELEPYGSCRLCLVETERGVTTACTLKPREGLKVETLSDRVIEMRKTALELLLSSHYGDCIGPCQDACPAHADIQGYLALIARGKYHEAVKLMKEKYILPAVLGRVCPAFCEEACRRNLVDEPVGIRLAKRFAADYDLENGPWMPEIPPSTGKRVAVVGGGPAGLACAYYLRLKGHEVTIFEAMPELGGMTRYGIPEYRLPRDLLDEDIATVINTGIEVRTNTALGRDVTLEELREKYNAVFLAVGAWKSRKMGIPGEDLEGVMHGIEFLRKVNTGEEVKLGERVIVVGGGNTAMDVARTALRLGAKVTVVYRRSKAEMPANEREVEEAIEEGVEFLFLANPVRIIGDGRVEEVELIKMRLGEPDSSGRRRPIPIEGSEFRVKADNVILAIGQYCDEEFLKGLGIEARRGRAVVDEITLQTNVPGVFAGGDLVLGPSTVIESIATGRRGALMIDLYLRGRLEKAREVLANPEKHIRELTEDRELYELLLDLRPYNHWRDVTEEDYRETPRRPRVRPKLLDPKERAKGFEEVEKTLSEREARSEASRCMSCGCLAVFDCRLREYATLYGVKPELGRGEKRFEIDESHPRITLDPNKCVLCGLCVRFTHEIAGEGVIDYLFRGYNTRVGPPLGDTIADVDGKFIGELADVCPVGAIVERPPLTKPGPWKTEKIKTVCNGCSLACEMAVEVYAGTLVRASSVEDSWNKYLCDVCRFERPWEKTLSGLLLNGKPVSWEEAKKFIESGNYALVLTPDLTNEEIEALKAFAERKGVPIGSTVSGSPSTATLDNVRKAKRVLLRADTEKFPLLKILLRGKEIVEKDYELAVTEDGEALNVPTLVLRKGANAEGLIRAWVTGIPKAERYVVVSNEPVELPGETLVIPAGRWAEKGGTVTNALGMELKVEKVREGYSPLGLFS
ncbi:NAD(P)-binding protein [Thermococcus sp. AM4]|uniref:NAD(P)-binding protein n=1 Tax=Thermococcus sp. (strain AM4) TaxID=246969 RepID=UPI0001870974|nr:NAD(P)-binding protein [Thermococcus sp. AM4]EEB73820.1 putative NADPH-dependent sulfur oxidoreductase NsoABCD subunit C [Thermococcus sp. AM4]